MSKARLSWMKIAAIAVVGCGSGNDTWQDQMCLAYEETDLEWDSGRNSEELDRFLEYIEQACYDAGLEESYEDRGVMP